MTSCIGRRGRPRLSWIRHPSEGGQAVLEFAMVLPLLLLLIFGLVDFGRAYYTWLVVTNAAREGARVGATQQPLNTINTRVYDTVGGLDSDLLTISVTNVQGARGEAIEVDLEYEFDYVTPIGDIMGIIGGDSISSPTITGHASMRLE